MPRSVSLFLATLRLPTLVGVAVLQGAYNRRPSPLLMFAPARAIAVLAAAKPTTTSVSTTFRSCSNKTKRFLSSSGVFRRPLPFSLSTVLQTPLLPGRRVTSVVSGPPFQKEQAALLSGICLPSSSAPARPNRQGSGRGVFAPAESSLGPLLPAGQASKQPVSAPFTPLCFAGGTHGTALILPRFPFTIFAEGATAQSRFGSGGRIMAFTLPPLPYPEDALSPHISAETLRFHHGKHHAAYVKKLNELVKGSKFESMSLEDVIRQSSGGIFNNAAQAWNHTFYFNCMKSPKEGGGKEPQGPLRDALLKKWNTYDKFKEEFSTIAAGHFGSGWAWLNYNKNKKELEIQQTHDADNPLTKSDQVPLLACDVWEHAYYIDRRNDRGAYIKAWWEVVNWSFAEKNYAHATS